MKLTGKILSIVMMFTLFATSVQALDTNIPRSPNTRIMNDSEIKTDIYLEEPYSNPFKEVDGKLVRKRYIKLAESSIGDLMNAKRITQLMRGQTYVTNTETVTRKLVEEDFEIKGTVSATFLKLIKAEISSSYKKHIETEVINKISIGTSYSFDSSELPLYATHKDIYAGFFKDKYEVVTDIVEKELVEKKTRIIRTERFDDCFVCDNDGGFGGERSRALPIPQHICEKGYRFLLEDGRYIYEYDQDYMNFPYPFNGRIEGMYYVEDVMQWNYAGMKTFTSYMYVPVKGVMAVYIIK
ncbi:hypothetical protein [Oceanirhabdus sp. W0125-5]|uniref:hypothetical protein n=1 Tax=Oceanirhabdus sp. W0125-5 TaxID=2999116 RepID=UPI0022F2C391|nr:hypothetical protein [Oceanirhabdus sp. W0125-5]WBW95819.1 hypothetical protein OW730_19310 [Oceanirhabdus sp. W0125-5]